MGPSRGPVANLTGIETPESGPIPIGTALIRAHMTGLGAR